MVWLIAITRLESPIHIILSHNPARQLQEKFVDF